MYKTLWRPICLYTFQKCVHNRTLCSPFYVFMQARLPGVMMKKAMVLTNMMTAPL